MPYKIPRLLQIISALFITFSTFVQAALPGSIFECSPVCDADSVQSVPAAVGHPSGGGAVITWQDRRNGNDDIYAQRLSGKNTLDWVANGVAVCTATGDQQHPVIVLDSSEGTIIAWEDRRSGKYAVFAQRVNAWGVVQWSENGRALCVSLNDQRNPSIVRDSAGGAIITWEENRSSAGNTDIYAQRISGDGTLLWDEHGVAVCVQAAEQASPRIICNLRGGAIITWQDKRSGDNDIYAQRIDATGVVLWTTNGVAICSAALEQQGPQMTGDGLNGAIIVWDDFRSSIDYNIFAQRIGADGVAQWPVDGLVINNNMSGDQLNPVIVRDGSGGAIIAWEDKRVGNFDIYGQRINSAGAVLWAATGVEICTDLADQRSPRIASEYKGGAKIAWSDNRTAVNNIYAQWVSADGIPRAGKNGIVICATNGLQFTPVIVSDDCTAETIVTWQDMQADGYDIYTRLISEDSIGILEGQGHTTAQHTVMGTMYIEQSGKVRYTIKDAGRVSLEILDLSGRLRAILVSGYKNPGSYFVSISTNAPRGRMSSGVYFCRLIMNNSQTIQLFSVVK